jgi:hypothetical protein
VAREADPFLGRPGAVTKNACPPMDWLEGFGSATGFF